MLASVDDRALGTGVRVVVTDAPLLATAKAAVDATLRAVDAACSRFRDDSELTRLNACAGGETRISPLLARAIAEGLRAARLTGGDVDPTVGAALRLAGYDRDYARIARDGAALTLDVRPVPGWRTIRLNTVACSVSFPRGVEIDLGATAKALAADHAAAAAHATCGCGVLVSLGGDIALAGEAPADEGWRIRVTDDHRSDVTAPGQWITLTGGGLATSSITTRNWRSEEGATMHHLIDPATGRPVSSAWRTASVAASSCLDANIASTAAIVRGEAAISWLTENKLPSRLVDRDGHARHVGGWPTEGDDLG